MNIHPTPSHPPDASDVRTRRLAVATAVVLHAVVAVPFTVGLGLFAPPWAIVAGIVSWLAGAAALVIVARRRPLLSPLVPVVAATVLAALVTTGGSVLGWSP